MKIAQIVCSYPPYSGGIGQSAYRLYESLKNTHSVKNFTLSSPESNAKPSPDTIYLRPLIRYGHGALSLSLFKHLKNFEVLYFHYPFFGADFVIWLYKIFHPQQRLFIHYHMDSPQLAGILKILSWPSKLIRNSLLKKSEIIVTASLDYIQNSQIKNFYHKYPSKFQEIPFGIDINKFYPLANKNNSIKKILFVGGLDQAHYFKGIDILLLALSKITNYKWEMIIAGGGDLQASYEQLATELKIDKSIKFLGKIPNDELPQIFRQADFFVLPSINSHEAFGIVLIEALSSGLALIASRLYGVRSVFTDGVEGYQVKPGDVSDLADKITQMLRNSEDQLRNMGLQARALAEQKYDSQKISRQYENLFNK